MTNGGTFEALNYALRKSKDGVIVSFVVHPSDVDSALTALPIGARVEIKWAELNDEQPSSREMPPAPPGGSREPQTAAPQSGEETAATPSKPRILSLSSQCALRCKDKRFWEWLREGGWMCDDEASAIVCLYRIMSISSRAELDSDERAAFVWRNLESDFQHHLTDQMHAGSYR